ncbi:P-loop containing nucleoside triphosphate hydrolase protein [Penicillium cinerascens]|uniref:P-loop containing nucleoside triphosphate hydrolase protein n=1 Tax=Penicillium cinerascens TaxID=70096 RepID=A0A9W9J5E6_9EURO|nr:P-loop containing nucleoside triphosphate hydrolase protein [Penicillium cinerascens]KAJ5190903.1 P-loop containing nucleoside triphosphate hydrolase protein [Penicillium cinerascens]
MAGTPAASTQVEHSTPVRGVGTCVIGKVERGSVKAGDVLDILRWGTRRRTMCTRVLNNEEVKDHDTVYSRVTLALRGVDTTDVKRGSVLTTPPPATPNPMDGKSFKASAQIVLVNPEALEDGQEVVVLSSKGKKIGTATVSMPLES